MITSVTIRREIATLPVRSTATTWKKATELILGTLEALGFEDRDSFERSLGHLAPLVGYLLATYEFRREELVLDCGRVTLRLRFLYDETSCEREDLSVPFVAFVEEAESGSVPTVAIATARPVAGTYLLRCVERAESGGVLRVSLLEATPEQPDPVPSREEDEGGEEAMARVGDENGDASDAEVTTNDDQPGGHR